MDTDISNGYQHLFRHARRDPAFYFPLPSTEVPATGRLSPSSREIESPPGMTGKVIFKQRHS